MHTTSKTEVLCLFGPTAVGKTEVLSQLQDRFSDFEVISADSVQVYKKLNIGSAKPTREDQKKLPHHLLDILEPDQQFSAGDFVSRADAAVKDVISRSRVPLITGGTAFYFVNYLFGLPGTPIADPEIRRRVEDLVETQGPEALHALLSQVDPLSHERLEMRDLYRRKRALEVFWGSGRPLSDFQVSREIRPGISPHLFALDRPRDELYQRIDARVETMMDTGFEKEVDNLLTQGLTLSSPGLRSIRYLQLAQWIMEGRSSPISQVVNTIKQETRRYAKRQLTFFRRIPGVTWVNPREAVPLLEKLLVSLHSVDPLGRDS